MFEIGKRFSFSASHRLEGLPRGHKCGRMHGHNYDVEVILAREELDAHGFVVDYGELTRFKDYIDRHLDHRHLNDVIEGNPTAEVVAQHLYRFASRQWPEVIEVRVSETPPTWASYRP